MQDKEGYLVLTRKLEQTICISDQVEITVLQIKGKQIRLGVKCKDPTLPIFRKEVMEKDGFDLKNYIKRRKENVERNKQ